VTHGDSSPPVPRAESVHDARRKERWRDGGIDQIPLPVPTGGLWLCGKHAIGHDPEAALARVGATTIVCLNEPHELLPRYRDYVTWLEQHRGDRAVWFPVPDLHAPTHAALIPFLSDLDERLARGEVLLMHCGAGIGRAGTMAAALLITFDLGIDEALATVAEHRPMAGPEAGIQRDLLDEVVRSRAGGSPAAGA
jgi:protein-tyrosine phosphatase